MRGKCLVRFLRQWVKRPDHSRTLSCGYDSIFRQHSRMPISTAVKKSHRPTAPIIERRRKTMRLSDCSTRAFNVISQGSHARHWNPEGVHLPVTHGKMCICVAIFCTLAQTPKHQTDDPRTILSFNVVLDFMFNARILQRCVRLYACFLV